MGLIGEHEKCDQANQECGGERRCTSVHDVRCGVCGSHAEGRRIFEPRELSGRYLHRGSKRQMPWACLRWF